MFTVNLSTTLLRALQGPAILLVTCAWEKEAEGAPSRMLEKYPDFSFQEA